MALDLGTIFVKIGAKNDELMKALSKSEQALEKFGSKMEGIGRTLSLRITAPLAAIGYKATQMAGEVVESENLFSVAMGKMETAGRKFTNAYAKSLGLNEYEMRKQMGTFKVMAESMGLTEQAAYDLSQGFTTLAYDLASFYNISFESAFEKLQSGMVGMVMPLRELGININETTVEAYALREGIIKQGESLTESGKVLARYGAIMEQARKAQGNLAREIDNPLSKQRILQEQVKALKKEFGDALLPMFNKLLDVAGRVVEKLKDMTEAFKNLSPEVQETWIKVGLFVALLGPASLLIGGLTKTLSSLTSILKGVGAAFTAVAAFAGKVAFGFQAVKAGAATIGEAISFALGPLGLFIAGLGIVFALYKAIDYLTYKVFDGEIVDAKVNQFLANINFLGKGEMYASAAQKALDDLEKKRNGTKEKSKNSLAAVGEEVKGLYNEILKGLDLGQFVNNSTKDAKKSIDEIYGSLQGVLWQNSVAAKNMGKEFDKLGEDASAYESALREAFANGLDPSNSSVGRKILDGWKQVLDDIETQARVDLLNIYDSIEMFLPTKDGKHQTASFGLDLEDLLNLPDEQFGEFISSVGLAKKAAQELDSAFVLGLLDATDMWAGYQDILKSLSDSLLGVYSSLGEGPAKEAIGELLQNINASYGDLEINIKIANQDKFEANLKDSIEKAIRSSIIIDTKTGEQIQNPRNALKVYSDALSQYLSAGFSDSSNFALELKNNIMAAQKEVGKLDFSDAIRKIEDDLEAGLNQTALTARTTIAKGGMFDSLKYQADLYEKAILERQSLMIQEGKSIGEVMSATSEWTQKLRELNIQIDAAAKKKIYKDWQKSMRDQALSQLPIAGKAFGMSESTSKAFAAGGMSASVGGVVGALIALASESESFKQALAVINPILQSASDALGRLLEPLLPVTVVLSSTLSPVLDALGVILSTVLEPALAAIFPILKLLGVAMMNVAYIFNWGQLQVAKMLSSAFQWLASLPLVGRSFRDLAEASKAKVDELNGKQTDLSQSMQDLINLSYEEAKAKAKLADTAREVSEALRNVPSGFKIALRRYQVSDPTTGSYQPTSQTPIFVNFNAPIFGMDDFEQEVKGIMRNATRSNSLALNGI
jgi:hypothetical protein